MEVRVKGEMKREVRIGLVGEEREEEVRGSELWDKRRSN